MDLSYVAGANNDCGDVICCRAKDGFPTEPEKQAGKLGNYGCDIPLDVLTTMGEIVNNEIKPDVMFFTGDTAPHDQ